MSAPMGQKCFRENANADASMTNEHLLRPTCMQHHTKSGDSSFYRIQILREDLIHGEHMHLVLLEDRAELFVAPDHAFVVWVLQIAFADVRPDATDRLGSRKLGGVVRDAQLRYACASWERVKNQP